MTFITERQRLAMAALRTFVRENAHVRRGAAVLLDVDGREGEAQADIRLLLGDLEDIADINF